MPRLTDPEDYPKAMLRYAREAVALAQNREQTDLDNDRIFELALAHLVQNVGTAAETTRRNRQFWNGRLEHERASLLSFRNRIAHDSDPMDRNGLWHAVTVSFPAIIPALETIVAANNPVQ